MPTTMQGQRHTHTHTHVRQLCKSARARRSRPPPPGFARTLHPSGRAGPACNSCCDVAASHWLVREARYWQRARPRCGRGNGLRFAAVRGQLCNRSDASPPPCVSVNLSRLADLGTFAIFECLKNLKNTESAQLWDSLQREATHRHAHKTHSQTCTEGQRGSKFSLGLDFLFFFSQNSWICLDLVFLPPDGTRTSLCPGRHYCETVMCDVSCIGVLK